MWVRGVIGLPIPLDLSPGKIGSSSRAGEGLRNMPKQIVEEELARFLETFLTNAYTRNRFEK